MSLRVSQRVIKDCSETLPGFNVKEGGNPVPNKLPPFNTPGIPDVPPGLKQGYSRGVEEENRCQGRLQGPCLPEQKQLFSPFPAL